MFSRNRHAQELHEQTATQDCHENSSRKKYSSNDVSII